MFYFVISFSRYGRIKYDSFNFSRSLFANYICFERKKGLLCEAGIKALGDTQTAGRAVSYEGLLENFIRSIIPDHFGIPMTEDASERIRLIGSRYSKGRGNRGVEWKDDTEKKKNGATPEIKAASELFLDRWYISLTNS